MARGDCWESAKMHSKAMTYALRNSIAEREEDGHSRRHVIIPDKSGLFVALLLLKILVIVCCCGGPIIVQRVGAHDPGLGVFSHVLYQTLQGNYQENFGTSLAVSNDTRTLVVGSPRIQNVYGSFEGGMFAYSRGEGVDAFSSMGGRMLGSGVTNTPAAYNTATQGMDVAISGDALTVASGGVRDNNQVGAVWIFVRSSATSPFTQQAKLTPSGYSAAVLRFGFAVALSFNGNVLAVGTEGNNDHVGEVYIFRRSSTLWYQEFRVEETSNTFSKGKLGASVAVSADGQIVAVGARYGYVKVYSHYSGSWVPEYPVIPPSHSYNDFGPNTLHSGGKCVGLSADGHRMIAGRGQESTSIFEYFVWQRTTNGTWSLVVRGSPSSMPPLTNPGFMGSSCAMSADGSTFAVVGGHVVWGSAANKLAVFIFKISLENTVTQAIADPVQPPQDAYIFDYLGSKYTDVALSADGNELWLSAGYTANDLGGVWRFKYVEHTWSPSGAPSATPSTSAPSVTPSTSQPSLSPSKAPTTSRPSLSPSTPQPSKAPSTPRPSVNPSGTLSQAPSLVPSHSPSSVPSHSPSSVPSHSPSSVPTTTNPSQTPHNFISSSALLTSASLQSILLTMLICCWV